MSREKYLQSLDIASKQYKLAVHVQLAAHSGSLPQRCVAMVFGKISLKKEDLVLSDEDAALASTALEHCATFMLAVVLDTALEKLIPDRFNGEFDTASRIARVLRNAFAHDPFYPTWNLTNSNHIGRFEISNVIVVDTTTLNGQRVHWSDYGGPLAILRFVDYCRQAMES